MLMSGDVWKKKKKEIVCRITGAAFLCRAVPSSAAVFAAQPEESSLVGKYKKSTVLVLSRCNEVRGRGNEKNICQHALA